MGPYGRQRGKRLPIMAYMPSTDAVVMNAHVSLENVITIQALSGNDRGKVSLL